MRKLFHGSFVTVAHPEIRIHKFTKDFSWGFYCTEFEMQAVRWATRFNRVGFVNVYTHTENPDLLVKTFPGLTEEWLDFIVACRNGGTHNYDIVEGPMADDRIFDEIQRFLDGEITRAAFWELARFKHPTHQISFHTTEALKTLKFEGSYRPDV